MSDIASALIRIGLRIDFLEQDHLARYFTGLIADEKAMQIRLAESIIGWGC